MRFPLLIKWHWDMPLISVIQVLNLCCLIWDGPTQKNIQWCIKTKPKVIHTQVLYKNNQSINWNIEPQITCIITHTSGIWMCWIIWVLVIFCEGHLSRVFCFIWRQIGVHLCGIPFGWLAETDWFIESCIMFLIYTKSEGGTVPLKSQDE